MGIKEDGMFHSHNIVMKDGLFYSPPYYDLSENLNKGQSFQVGGESEECSSSESGWTMYLASPMHDDDDGDGDGDGEVEDGGGGGGEDHNRRRRSNSYGGYNEEDGGGGGDDDSMASDASSGPASYMGHGKCNKPEIKEKGVGRKNHKVEGKCKREERKSTARGSKKEQVASASFHGNSKGRKTKTDK